MRTIRLKRRLKSEPPLPADTHARGVVNIDTEVEQRRSIERAERDQDRYLQQLLNDGPAVICEEEFDGSRGTVTTYMSSNFERIFGYPRSEVNKSGWFFDRVHPDDVAAAKDTLDTAISAGTEIVGIRLRFLRGGGYYVWMLTHIRLVYDDDGGPNHMVWTAVDVTEQVNAEERNRELEARRLQFDRLYSLGTLAAGVAHDFTNLLSIVLANSELIRTALPTDRPLSADLKARCDEVAVYLSAIEDASARAFRLTQQLLTFGGPGQLRTGKVVLGSVLADLSPLLRQIVGDSVEVEINSALGRQPVTAHRGQVEQVIVNLVANARDATPRGGRIVITTQHRELDKEWCESRYGVSPGHFVSLTVADDGVGMTRRTKEKAFEPFFSTKLAGTGLGLATVYGVARAAGGTVEIFSELGIGTAVTVHFPFRQAIERSATMERLPAIRRGDGLTAVVLSNHPSVSEAAYTALVAAGYVVLVFADTGEFLAMCADNEATIDVLVTDVAMPGHSGIDVAKRAASMRPLLPVVFMTVIPHDSLPAGVRLRLAERSLTKPFSSVELTRMVGDSISNATQAAE